MPCQSVAGWVHAIVCNSAINLQSAIGGTPNSRGFVVGVGRGVFSSVDFVRRNYYVQALNYGYYHTPNMVLPTANSL